MKRLLLFVIILTLFVACEKETVDDLYDSGNMEMLKSGKKSVKIDVCHFSEENGTWEIITISENAWPAHENHGDVRLDDWDRDGFVPDNSCGIEPMGDLDDFDADIHPVPPGQNPDDAVMVTDLHLGGPGYLYYGPTCDIYGSIKTSFFITGTGLPLNKVNYVIVINNTEYGIGNLFRKLPYNQIAFDVYGLPDGVTGSDVTIKINFEGKLYSFTFGGAYSAPECP